MGRILFHHVRRLRPGFLFPSGEIENPAEGMADIPLPWRIKFKSVRLGVEL
jgi:hypothetical protein